MSGKHRPKQVSLKELKTRKDQLQTKLDLSMQAQADATNNIRTLRARIDEIEDDIRRLTLEPRVSEHAIIRYLEHIIGFDTQQVRDEILDDAMRSKINAVGSGKIPLTNADGKAIVKNKTIVSIIPNGESAKDISK